MKVYTFDEMVTEVENWLSKSNDSDRDSFVNIQDENELFLYHHFLGRKIRNHFKLWEREWEKQVDDGFDCSLDHPDQTSHRVIVEVWKRNRVCPTS